MTEPNPIDVYSSEDVEPFIKNLKRNWWLYIICFAIIIFALLSIIYVKDQTDAHDAYWLHIIDSYCPQIYDMYGVNKTYGIMIYDNITLSNNIT